MFEKNNYLYYFECKRNISFKVTANLDKAPFYKKLLFKWAFANKEQEVLK